MPFLIPYQLLSDGYLKRACSSLLVFILALIAFPTFSTGTAKAQEYTNSIGMEFVLIPSGTFIMGSNLRLEDGMLSERPRHLVRITKPFYLSKYEVTQAQWEAIMGTNPSFTKGERHPVEYVTWWETILFIYKLNAKENTIRYRLPSEAEWEYAARGGSSSTYFFGDNKDELGDYAWYEENSDDCTHEVGLKKPNSFGLYDIYGNVREWVYDTYGTNYYASSPTIDPKGPEEGDFRVSKGCSWIGNYWNCRSASKEPSLPSYRFNYMGFRLAFWESELGN
ncbi:MAG: formylglycine-generating enzyme family protein [Deltaproteobacteria bacterium]|nr:formylglycine-generating enzyme family protein [Deltaproteobacteria bacterium]